MRRAQMTIILVLTMVATAAIADAPLTLDRALELAAAHHPSLAAATADAAAARGDARQQGAWPNPSAFLEYEAAPTDGATWQEADRVIGLEQTFPLGGRLGASREAGDLLARGAEARRDAAARGLEADVRAAFARTLHARATAELRTEIAAAARRSLDIVAARHAQGDAADADMARARWELGVAELATGGADADLHAARADLAALVGVAADALPDLDGALGAPRAVPPLDDLLTACTDAPARRAAEAVASAGEASARAASRDRIPDLGVSAGLRRLGGDGGDAFDVGVSLDLPLFDRGGARAGSARAAATAAAARSRATALDLERRVRALHARWTTADVAVRALDGGLLADADAVRASSERRHEAGDLELADLLLVRTVWLERRLEGLDARLELDLAQAELAGLL